MCTDGDTAYYNIVDEVGAHHKLCTFHIMQNLTKHTIKIQNYNKRQIKSYENKIENSKKKMEKIRRNKDKNPKKNKNRLQKLNKQISEYKLEIKKMKNELKDLDNYVERISNIFKCDTEKSARRRFNMLLNDVENLPTVIAIFVKNLSKYFDRAIAHIKYKYLPNTNNKLERFFGMTMPKYLKRRFRTDRGLELRIKLADIRWMERNLQPR